MLKSWLEILSFMVFLGLGGCSKKVDIGRIGTSFPLFKSFWFESENTLYVFYHVQSSQKIRSDARVELSWDGESWSNIQELANIQLHEPVDCGPGQICGSVSLRAEKAPTRLSLRYRFHKDGSLADVGQSFPVAVHRQPGVQNRSFYVFGVFDKTNHFIQWRGRNAFPGFTHEQAEAYGLRRPYEVKGLFAHNSSSEPSRLNPSLYGSPFLCSGDSLGPVSQKSAQGEDIWTPVRVEDIYAEACTTSRSVDARGPYESSALARKNPVVTPIEQDLALAFTEASNIPFLFADCSAGDADYLSFQLQRLQMLDRKPDVCLESVDFNVKFLRDLIGARVVEARRQSNKNLAILIILHYTKPEASAAIVETLGEALQTVLDSSLYPRVAATFVYDSFAAALPPVSLKPAIIWCPTLAADQETLNSCYFQQTKFTAGPIEVRLSPLLPDFTGYKKLDDEQKNGIKVEGLRILTVAEPQDQDRLDLIDSMDRFWAFHPADRLTLQPNEYLSYCNRADTTQSLAFRAVFDDPLSVPDLGGEEPMALVGLPEIQNTLPTQRTVQVGISMPYSFYVSLRYSSRVAVGPKGATGLIAIRGRSSTNDELGAAILNNQRITMSQVLHRCTQYCNHPAFDEAASYLLSRPWQEEFRTRCYEPTIPKFPGG